MPKIPLYTQQANVNTAQGVTIDGSKSISLAGAEASSDYNLMSSAVGLGQDFVNQKIELKTNADKSKYALWEDDFTLKREEERKKFQSEGKTEDEIYEHLTGNDFADNNFKTWAQENDVVLTREMQNDWNEYKSENKKREFISLEKIKLEKNIISIVQKSDKLRLEDKHEEADAEIDKLPISPIEKEKYKTQGYYSYYLNKGQKLAADGNEDLLIALKNEALSSDNKKINFSQRQQLEVQFRSLSNRYFSNIGTNTIPKWDTMLTNNELTFEFIDNSVADATTKNFYKTKLALQDEELNIISPKSGDLLYTYTESINEDGNKEKKYNEIEDIPDSVIGQTGTYADDVAVAVINVLQGMGVDGKGKSQDFTRDVKLIMDLINATDKNGRKLISDNMKERVAAPLFKIMADENKNNIFADRLLGDNNMKKPDANSFDEVKTFGLAAFLDALSDIKKVVNIGDKQIAGTIPIVTKLEGVLTALEKVDMFLETIEKKEADGVVTTTPKRKNLKGRTKYYDYKDDVAEAINTALAPLNAQVSKALMNKYYNPPSDGDDTLINRLITSKIIPENEIKFINNKEKNINETIDADLSVVKKLQNEGMRQINIDNIVRFNKTYGENDNVFYIGNGRMGKQGFIYVVPKNKKVGLRLFEEYKEEK